MSLLLGSRRSLLASPGSYGPGLLSSLAAYWNLEEASGARLDSVAGLSLTDTNTVTQAAGIQGNAAQFVSANSEHLTTADEATMRVGSASFTLALWLYPDTGAQTAWPLNKYSANTGYSVQLSGGGVVFIIGAAVNTTLTSGLSPATTAWSFLVIWVDAAAALVCAQMNNGAVASTALVNPQVDGTGGFFLGSRSATQLFFNGRMDEVALWKRVLTAGERTALYASGNGRTYPFAGF